MYLPHWIRGATDQADSLGSAKGAHTSSERTRRIRKAAAASIERLETRRLLSAVQFSVGSETVNESDGTFSIPVTLTGPAVIPTVTTFASGFSNPQDGVFDAAGNLYVTNFAPGTVSKITPAGVVSTFATGLPNATGLAIDAAGNLYVSNPSGNSVSKVTPGGVVSPFATGFTHPKYMTFDTAGNLYVGNQGSTTISKVTPAGVVSTFATGMYSPEGLAFDAAGNLYVANYYHNTVMEVTPAGVVSTFASNVDDPFGMAFDSAGNLFVTNSGSSSLTEVTPGGVVFTFVSGFSNASGLTQDAAGNIYVMNDGTNVVSKVVETSVSATVPFTLGGTAVSGTDYSGLTASPLTFAPSQITQNITGTLMPDPGSSQTLVITLGTPNSLTLGSPAVNTLAINEPTAVPVISSDPSNATVDTGGNTSFASAATGNPTPTQQWQVSTDGGTTFTNITDGGVYSGSTSTTLTINGATVGMNGYEYQDVFTNGNSTATTTPSILTVDFAPTVTTNPTNSTINTGGNASFTVAATGNPTPTVQWQLSTDGGTTFNNITDGGIYSGSATDTLTLTGATPDQNGYEYQAVFTNTLLGAGSPSTAMTTAATLTVNAAPLIDIDPTSTITNAGGNTSFTSSVTGNSTATEQWQVSTDGGTTFTNVTDGGVYSGSTSNTLTITGATAGMNGYEYQDVFTNGNGTTTTTPSTLTVDLAPTVTTNPINSTINTGGNVSFAVAATGNPTPTVQWQVSTDGGTTFTNIADGGSYSGSATDTLTLTGATLSQNGYQYRAVFSNTQLNAGSPVTATTSAATLTVGTPVITVAAYAQLVSARSNTGTLHVQALQDGTDANLTYTWSVIDQPTIVSSGRKIGASAPVVGSEQPLVVFSMNGTNSAKNTSATFQEPGQYTLQVVASSGIQSATSQVLVTSTVKAAVTNTTTQVTQVSGVQPVGDGKSISGFVVTFNGPVDPITAQNVAGYRILRESTSTEKIHIIQSWFGSAPENETIFNAYKIASAVYDSQTDSVSLTLAAPMPVVNGVRLVDVLGTGKHAVLDANGKPIDGDGNGRAGGNFSYALKMSVAKSVTYESKTADAVKLSVTGPGEIVSLLPTGTRTPIIDLVDTESGSSILTGKLHKKRNSLAYVVLDELNGTANADVELGSEFYVNQANPDPEL